MSTLAYVEQPIGVMRVIKQTMQQTTPCGISRNQ